MSARRTAAVCIDNGQRTRGELQKARSRIGTEQITSIETERKSGVRTVDRGKAPRSLLTSHRGGEARRRAGDGEWGGHERTAGGRRRHVSGMNREG